MYCAFYFSQSPDFRQVNTKHGYTGHWYIRGLAHSSLPKRENGGLLHSRKGVNFFSCPGRIFSYCVRARAYTHVLARVYSTRASTCTIYTCFTLPHTRVNLTGLQLWGFQRARSFEIVEIVGIAVSVFVIIGWVGQIQYQKPRSK